MGKKVSENCFLLLLALLQITTPSTAQSTTALRYLTRPADVTVAVGESAVFSCGVPKASPNLTFTFYASSSTYSLTCPLGHFEDVSQALYGSCEMKDEESLAVWTLEGTSFSNNGTRVVCQQSNNLHAVSAVLHVYDNGTSRVTLIGCVIGGFFGTLLVAGLSYLLLQRSDTLQSVFRGKDTEDDTITIVEDEKNTEN